MKHYIVFVFALVLAFLTFAAGQETLVSIDLARKNATAMSLVWTEHQSTSIRLNVKRNGEDFDLTGWENRLVIGDGTTGLVVTGAQTGYGDCVFTVDPASIPTNGRYSVAITAEQGYHTEEWARGVLRVELDHGVNYMPTSWYGWEKVARLAATFVDSNNVVSVNGKHGNVELEAHDVNAYTQDETDAKIGAHGSRTDNPHGVTAEQAGAYTKAAVDAKIANHTGRTDNPHGVTAAQAGAVPVTRKVNGKVLSSDVTLTPGDVGAVPTTRKVNGLALSGDITITTVDHADEADHADSADNATRATSAGSADAVTWQNVSGKPTTLNGYGITDAVPATRKVNNKALSANVQLGPGDVGAWDSRYEVGAALALGYYGRVFAGGTAPYSLTWNATRKRYKASWAVGEIPTSDNLAYLSDFNGYVPTTRTINGKALSANVTLAPADIGAVTPAAIADMETLTHAGQTYATKTAVADVEDQVDEVAEAVGELEAKIGDAVIRIVDGKPVLFAIE